MSRQRYLRCLYALVRRWTLCQASNSDAESCFNPLLLGLGADELMIPVARSPRTFHDMILAYRLVNDPAPLAIYEIVLMRGLRFPSPISL